IVAPGHLTNNINFVTSIIVFFLLSTSAGKTAIRLLSLKQQKYTKTRSATKYQPNLCRQPTRPSALRSCDKLDCTGRGPADFWETAKLAKMRLLKSTKERRKPNRKSG